jgi:hypothetical protein
VTVLTYAENVLKTTCIHEADWFYASPSSAMQQGTGLEATG